MTDFDTPTDDPDTYWILDPEQIECLASSVRMTLIDRLVADGPLPADELARRVGLRPTAIYHHLTKLAETGLVVETGSRRAPGAKKPQIIYATPKPRMRMLRAFGDPANADALTRCTAAILRQAQRDFAAGFGNDAARAGGPQRNHGFSRLTARPDADTLARINAHLDAIHDLLWQANDPDQPALSLAWVIAPQDTPSNQSEGET